MLFNVLKAYAAHNQETGYCQGQGPIAALLLMHMPEEDSFWTLIQISDVYLKGYFKPGLEALLVDGKLLECLFKRENKFVHDRLVELEISSEFYTTEWLMCIYVRTLPWCTVLRIFDMFICEGKLVLIKVGLYLMRAIFSDRKMFVKMYKEGMYEVLNMFKNKIPLNALKEENLVKEICDMKLTDEDLKQLRRKHNF